MKYPIRITEVESQSGEDSLWEFYHENSKVDKNKPFLSNDVIVRHMQAEYDSLYYPSARLYDLKSVEFCELGTLDHAINSRESARSWPKITSLNISEIATLLNYSYGLSSARDSSDSVRYMRVTPSGGGLYPLEIFISSRNVDGLPSGLYHYNPHLDGLQQLSEGDQTFKFSSAFIQKNVVESAAAIFFFTAIFKRTTFKYGARGYRFSLIEAGHVAQNANLVASSLGLKVLNMGGFFDREVDEFLNINGVDHSTVYCLAFGR